MIFCLREGSQNTLVRVFKRGVRAINERKIVFTTTFCYKLSSLRVKLSKCTMIYGTHVSEKIRMFSMWQMYSCFYK